MIIGYFCPGGVIDPSNNTLWESGRYKSSNYSSLLCPKGHRCPIASSLPIICESGSYQDKTGQGNCTACPKGFWCGRGTVIPYECPLGSYCPEYTEFATQYLCANGTYGARTNLTSQAECTSCTPGMYCDAPGLTQPTGPCKEGYFCGGGSKTATPHESYSSYAISYTGDTCVKIKNTTVNDICPPAHYCEVGSSAPTPCPQGSNSSSTSLTRESQCSPCKSGYRCPNKATVYATELCYEGKDLRLIHCIYLSIYL